MNRGNKIRQAKRYKDDRYWEASKKLERQLAEQLVPEYTCNGRTGSIDGTGGEAAPGNSASSATAQPIQCDDGDICGATSTLRFSLSLKWSDLQRSSQSKDSGRTNAVTQVTNHPPGMYDSSFPIRVYLGKFKGKSVLSLKRQQNTLKREERRQYNHCRCKEGVSKKLLYVYCSPNQTHYRNPVHVLQSSVQSDTNLGRGPFQRGSDQLPVADGKDEQRNNDGLFDSNVSRGPKRRPLHNVGGWPRDGNSIARPIQSAANLVIFI